MTRLLILCGIATIALAIGCQPGTQTQTQDTKAADEAALKAIDAEWSKAAGTGNVEKTISYYAGDATLLPPNGPTITAKDAIGSFGKK